MWGRALGRDRFPAYALLNRHTYGIAFPYAVLGAVGDGGQLHFFSRRHHVECYFGLTFLTGSTERSGGECGLGQQCFPIEECNLLNEVIGIVGVCVLVAQSHGDGEFLARLGR